MSWAVVSLDCNRQLRSASLQTRSTNNEHSCMMGTNGLDAKTDRAPTPPDRRRDEGAWPPGVAPTLTLESRSASHCLCHK